MSTNKRGGANPARRQDDKRRSNPGGARPKRRPDDKRGGSRQRYWRGEIGADGVYSLAVMGLQDAVKHGIEQTEAEAQLVARLIEEERLRRLNEEI